MIKENYLFLFFYKVLNLRSVSYLNHGTIWLYRYFYVVFDCFTWNRNCLKQLQSVNKMCFRFEVCVGDSNGKLWLALWVLEFLFNDLSFMALELIEIVTRVQESLKKKGVHWGTSFWETVILFITQGILANSLLAHMFSSLFLSVGLLHPLYVPLVTFWASLQSCEVKAHAGCWNLPLKIYSQRSWGGGFITQDLETLGRLRTYPLWKP